MKSRELMELFKRNRHVCHLIGTEKNGVIIGLSLEGRFFAFLDGEVVSRVNPRAFFEQSSMEEYINPGGDGLWPAPEGSCLGYEYSTGIWRVPPGITGALYRVVSSGKNHVHISAEIDLVNNLGIGVPAVFSRQAAVKMQKDALAVTSMESVKYIGRMELKKHRAVIAPWSLCQFDCKEGCEVVLPAKSKEDIWDLYRPSDEFRHIKNGLCRIKTEGRHKFQVGIGDCAKWIEYSDPHKKIKVRRQAKPIEEGFKYCDIADRPPGEKPGKKGVKYSVYNDAAGFMEIEAAGGVPKTLKQNCVSKVLVETVFQKHG